ncbi:MAG: DnaJ C-terminal domain-containing protein [Actinomycetes bacterium]
MASQDWLEKDFYKVLGVAKDVSEAELKKTYRKLARKYHPDSNPGDARAEAKFKEITEANSVLSDPEQRKEYDQFRAMGGGARFTAPGGSGQSSAGFEDVFANLFGGRAGFGGFGGPTPGQDLSATTSIAFIDSVNGTTIKLEYSGMAAINAKIPAGVLDGQKIKLRGKGQPSPNGGPNGDLIITVTVKPHTVFSRDGNNLRLTVPITFAEAVLGATITVPTLGGDPVKLKVAPNTPNGRVLRVKGKGVTTVKGTGDLLATVEVLVPAHISDKAAKALKEFEEALPDEDPRQDLLNRAGLL